MKGFKFYRKVPLTDKNLTKIRYHMAMKSYDNKLTVIAKLYFH